MTYYDQNKAVGDSRLYPRVRNFAASHGELREYFATSQTSSL